jgi:hypothetical protein
MSFRVVADDGSIHQFPDGTRTEVIASALARYHAALAAGKCSGAGADLSRATFPGTGGTRMANLPPGVRRTAVE